MSAVQHSEPVLFLIVSPVTFYHSDWIPLPVLDSRTSLLVPSKWNGLHLLTPNSPSRPLPPFLPPLATTSLFSMSVITHLSNANFHFFTGPGYLCTPFSTPT